MDAPVDYKKLRYVLYARKSTDDQKKQVRSIPDQVVDCEEISNRLGLKVIGPYLKESKSAKLPNRRPLYRKMVNDIKLGRYDAILSWSPDRLARNMLEAGELIDLLDQGVIKDLKFASMAFSPDANGKMMLGMSFVLSKQYSDDLSQKIMRGVTKTRAEGKSSVVKHGYVRDENGFQRPDGDNFILIKNAWSMRAKGEPLAKISKYLNDSGYERTIKVSGGKVKMDIKILSRLFKDTFYYGMLVEGADTVDLRDKFDFVQATTEEEFYCVQKLSRGRLAPFNIRRTTFFPLKGLVKCSYCHHNCVVAPSTGHLKKRYLYYRCDNQYCERKKRSIRGKFVFDFIYKFFEDNIKFGRKDYEEYMQSSKSIVQESNLAYDRRLNSINGELIQLGQEQDNYIISLGKLSVGSSSEERVNQKLKSIESKIDSLETERTNLKKDKQNPNDQIMSLDSFLNLCNNAVKIIKSANGVEKDLICRSMFLNLEVDEEKVTNFTLKEPFNTLVKSRLFALGPSGRS
ncbi:recombinase family protein [Candidatus Shapirobacteria bacterium]|nr:recombinase family protein [Candidatus Shapirobacteria bacterium]